MSRPRVPDAIKKARGTFQKCRALGGLKLAPGIPAMPSGLSPGARAAWRQVLTAVGHAGVITMADCGALTAYASAIGMARTYAKIAAQAPMIEGAHGPQVNPAARAAAQWSALELQFTREFGLTPASRSKVAATPELGTDNADEAFLFGPTLVPPTS